MRSNIRIDLILKSILTLIKQYTAIVALVIFTCLSTPAYSEGLGDAFKIYENYYLKKPSGVYVRGPLVFIIADIGINNKRIRSLHYEGKALLLTHKLLKEYIVQEMVALPETSQSLPGKLTEDLNHFISSGAFINFKLSSMNSRVLVNRSMGATYRRVALFYLDDISAKRNQLKGLLQDHERLINRFFKDATQNQRYDDLVQYFLELGLFREALINRKRKLDAQYHLVNYPAFEHNPYEERKNLRVVLTTKGNSKITPHLLKSLPGNVEIIDIIKKTLNEHDYLGQIVLDLTCLPSLPDTIYQERLNLIKHHIKMLSKQYPYIKEELELFAIPENDIFADADSSPAILKFSFLNFGFLDIASTYSNQENQYFLEAKELFKRGTAINKIFDLLKRSLQTSPRHVESWIYLGALLAHKGQNGRAMVMFQQAYFLDSSNLETAAHIADIYYRLNLKKTAKFYQAYLKRLNKTPQITFVKKIIDQIG